MKNKRAIMQWISLPLIFIVIGLGWKYPLLGLVVPLVITAALIISLFKGRYFCGNVCPRGAFYDRLVIYISPKKSMPKFLRHMTFRVLIIFILFSFLIIQLAQNFSNLNHWGMVFWLMCVVTTIIGIFLALFIHQRTWCTFCPVGTLQQLISNQRQKAKINLKCKQCIDE